MDNLIYKNPKNQKIADEIDSIIRNSVRIREEIRNKIKSTEDPNLLKIFDNEYNLKVLWELALEQSKAMLYVGDGVDSLESNTKESISGIMEILDVLGKDSKEVKEEIETLREKMKKMRKIKIQLAENLTFGINPLKFTGVET